MMNVIAFTEAKAKLSQILDRVTNGEEFVITRHDHMIAKLVPVRRASLEEINQTIHKLRESRKGVKVSIDEITAWKNQGRP